MKKLFLNTSGQARLQMLEHSDSGQALITLLFFTLIGLSIITAAIIISVSSNISSQKIKSGNLSFDQAETGAENAYLKLLRNPNYKGEKMTINNTTITITVSGTSPITITSRAVMGSFIRTVQVKVIYVNGQYTVQSWKELF